MASRAVKPPARRLSDKGGAPSLADGGGAAVWKPPGSGGGAHAPKGPPPPLPKGPPPPLPGPNPAGAGDQMEKVASLLPGGKVALPSISPSPRQVVKPRRPSSGSGAGSRPGSASSEKGKLPGGRPVARSNSAKAAVAKRLSHGDSEPKVLSRSNSASSAKGAAAAVPGGKKKPVAKKPSVKKKAGGGKGGKKAAAAADTLTLQVVTWNMNQTNPAGELPEALLRAKSAPADIYVIATQESGPLPAWERCVTEALLGKRASKPEGVGGEEGAGEYVLLAQETLWEISTLVYVRSSLKISNLRTGSVATGIGNVLGNKGGVGVGFTVGSATRVLLLNSHFAAHDDKVAERNADYARIANEMFGARGQGLDAMAEYDVAVWAGDFNYRVNSNRRAADVLIENEMWEVMRANDQLNMERKKGRCFVGFDEGDITFAPTFKFDNGTDTYDSSAKSRVPSWTDRVLWKCNPFTHPDAVTLTHYSNVPELKDSDHRPVVATLEVKLLPESGEGGVGESADNKSAACAIM